MAESKIQKQKKLHFKSKAIATPNTAYNGWFSGYYDDTSIPSDVDVIIFNAISHTDRNTIPVHASAFRSDSTVRIFAYSYHSSTDTVGVLYGYYY